MAIILPDRVVRTVVLALRKAEKLASGEEEPSVLYPDTSARDALMELGEHLNVEDLMAGEGEAVRVWEVEVEVIGVKQLDDETGKETGLITYPWPEEATGALNRGLEVRCRHRVDENGIDVVTFEWTEDD